MNTHFCRYQKLQKKNKKIKKNKKNTTAGFCIRTVHLIVWYVYVIFCTSNLRRLHTRMHACMQIHVSDFKAFAKMPACSSYEKDYTLVFLGLREEEEEEEMGERCKLCIIIIIFFFTYCWPIFPSLLYPACPSVAQKSKKSKLLASTPVYLAISPPNLQYLSIFSPCPSSRLCSLFASDFYQSIYPLSIQRAPSFALLGLSQAKQPDLSSPLPLCSLGVGGGGVSFCDHSHPTWTFTLI